MKNKLDKKTLDAYRSMLSPESVKEIFKKTGISRPSIYNFLNGKTHSYKIEFAVIKYIREKKEELEELRKSIGIEE